MLICDQCLWPHLLILLYWSSNVPPTVSVHCLRVSCEVRSPFSIFNVWASNSIRLRQTLMHQTTRLQNLSSIIYQSIVYHLSVYRLSVYHLSVYHLSVHRRSDLSFISQTRSCSSFLVLHLLNSEPSLFRLKMEHFELIFMLGTLSTKWPHPK